MKLAHISDIEIDGVTLKWHLRMLWLIVFIDSVPSLLDYFF